jgi:dihydrofolate synthase/folylpolyglutamate synthase
MVSPNQKDSVLNIIKNIAESKKSQVIVPDINDIAIVSSSLLSGMTLDYKGKKIKTSLVGKHQAENILTALMCLKNLNIPFQIVQEILAEIKMFARLEVLSKNPLVILDGAHNCGSILALKEIIKEHLLGKKIIGIVGMFRDKDVDQCLSNILPMFEKVITVSTNNPRALSAEELKCAAKKYHSDATAETNLPTALDHILQLYKKDKNIVIIIFGTFSLRAELF